MEYIENLLHFYDTSESFEAHQKQGLINPDSICFVKDTGQVHTQNSSFGISKEDFEELKQLALEHDSRIKDILGIEGPSVGDNIINNIADIAKFLEKFNESGNLDELLGLIYNETNALKESIGKPNGIVPLNSKGIIPSSFLPPSEGGSSGGVTKDEFDTEIEALNALIDTKVDKIDGKGLSTNDFTNEYKLILDNPWGSPIK